MKFKFFSLIVMPALLLPFLVLAQTSNDFRQLPAFNPICWEEETCLQVRSQTAGKDYKEMNEAERKEFNDGWIQGESPCLGERWGKCLPIGQTESSITFGGQSRFRDLSHFIQVGYNYAIRIGGLVAVIVIIVAGFQWVVAGGNAEVITKAKKRIGGALMGGFLVYMSYFILSALNPALVKLRLPDTYMVRPQVLLPEFCYQAPDATFAHAASSTDQLKRPKEENDPSLNFNLKIDKENEENNKTFECGARYYVSQASGLCRGWVCKNGGLCNNFLDGNRANVYDCAENVYLAGKISGGPFSSQSTVVVDDFFFDGVYLMALCSEGVRRVDSVQSEKPDQGKLGYYSFSSKQKLQNACVGKGDLLGFYIGAEINDETGGLAGWFGKLGGGSIFGYGCDDWFAVGRTPGTNICNVNLAVEANYITKDYPGYGCSPGNSIEACSCSFGTEERATTLAKSNNLEQIQKFLISNDELERGFNCDLRIDRSTFPPLDNANSLIGCNAGTIAGTTYGSTKEAAVSVLTVAGELAGCITTTCLDVTDRTHCLDDQTRKSLVGEGKPSAGTSQSRDPNNSKDEELNR